MSSPAVDYDIDIIDHPLDHVEDILSAHNWVFERMTADELYVQVNGQNCGYKIFFIWQNDMNALQLYCQYDLTVTSANKDDTNTDNVGADTIARTLMHINENSWMGHFDVPADTMTPTFRHTCLLRGLEDQGSAALLEDLVDVSLMQCEQNFAAFYVLCTQTNTATNVNDKTMHLALMETTGEA